MIKYTSFIGEHLDSFRNYMISCSHWNCSYESTLKTFDNYCINNYQNENILTQEIVDEWCTKRNTETNNSFNSRINGIIAFLKYTNTRNITNIIIPSRLKFEKKTYIPHYFTETELNNFFYACDHIELKTNHLISKNNKLTIPVFFRLLYSTGMRTIEARLLKVTDIDLYNGIINISKSKGYNQHYVVVNDLMKEYLVKYHNEISILYPNRTYFFPTIKDGHHPREWVTDNFKRMWNRYNSSNVIPYDLRHHYAITNINKWVNKGIDFTDKLYYLSRSMGHSSIESTKYYYTLIPRMSDIFKKHVNDTFDNIIPEIKEYD